MSTPVHHPHDASSQPGISSLEPSAALLSAGGLKNILGLPVQVIDGWHVFDCRTGEDEFGGTVKAPWGETLWGSERAAYSIGLRTSYMGDDTTPLSTSGCPDLRTWPGQYEKVARNLVKEAKRLMKDYENALANPAPEGEGGSVFHRPVIVAVCNFGGSVIADRRVFAVRRFMHLN